jgi:hypothetical protein
VKEADEYLYVPDLLVLEIDGTQTTYPIRNLLCVEVKGNADLLAEKEKKATALSLAPSTSSDPDTKH